MWPLLLPGRACAGTSCATATPAAIAYRPSKLTFCLAFSTCSHPSSMPHPPHHSRLHAPPTRSTVPNTGGVYFVPAFSGLLAPHWQDLARGTILGLTGCTSRAHVVRAMLEAICFQTREVLGAMRRDAVMELRALRVDGGATHNNLLMQLQADILQVGGGVCVRMGCLYASVCALPPGGICEVIARGLAAVVSIWLRYMVVNKHRCWHAGPVPGLHGAALQLPVMLNAR